MAAKTVNDLFYAWLISQLPAGVVSGNDIPLPGSGGISYAGESVAGFGTATGNNTSAGAVIATIPAASLPAGRYKVTVAHFISAATNPGMFNNVALKKGAVSIATIMHLQNFNAGSYPYDPQLEMIVDLNGATALNVTFIDNLGATETQTHHAQIIATKVG